MERPLARPPARPLVLPPSRFAKNSFIPFTNSDVVSITWTWIALDLERRGGGTTARSIASKVRALFVSDLRAAGESVLENSSEGHDPTTEPVVASARVREHATRNNPQSKASPCVSENSRVSYSGEGRGAADDIAATATRSRPSAITSPS